MTHGFTRYSLVCERSMVKLSAIELPNHMKRWITPMALAALLLATAGATDSPPPGGDRRTVVVLGDSLAAGYGLDPSQAFPALLQKKVDATGLKFTVVNAGVSGDTSAGGLR